ncbi:unnamed protein product [Musa banksii]
MDGSLDLIQLTVESIGSRDANGRIDVTEKPPPHEELATARSARQGGDGAINALIISSAVHLTATVTGRRRSRQTEGGSYMSPISTRV